MTSVIPLFRLFLLANLFLILSWLFKLNFKGKGQFQGQMRKYDFYEIQIATS